jgi:hypothetical protein
MTIKVYITNIKWFKIYIEYPKFKNRKTASSLMAGVGVCLPGMCMNNQIRST